MRIIFLLHSNGCKNKLWKENKRFIVIVKGFARYFQESFCTITFVFGIFFFLNNHLRRFLEGPPILKSIQNKGTKRSEKKCIIVLIKKNTFWNFVDVAAGCVQLYPIFLIKFLALFHSRKYQILYGWIWWLKLMLYKF